MKVALLTFHSFNKVKGGTELFSEHLRKAFPELRVVTYDDAARTSLPKLDRLNLQEPRMGLAISRRFKEMVREEDFDLVICNSTAGWWLSVLAPDLPMFNVYHYTMVGLARGTLRGTPGYLPSMYFLPLFERLTATNKECVAVSHKVRRELEGHYGIMSRVIENGIDLDKFAPIDRGEAREMLGIKWDGPLAVFVGRADHTKGFDVIGEFARSRPDIKVMCITPSLVEEDGMIVRHNVPNEAMPLHYSAADLLLFPSRYESFGYTALEAMACDLPVVASRTGIFEDLEDERAGIVVDGFDPNDYVKASDAVLNGRKVAPRSVVSSRFSMERFVDEYRAAAREAVSEHEARSVRHPFGTARS